MKVQLHAFLASALDSRQVVCIMSRSLYSQCTLKRRIDWTQRWCTSVCMSQWVCVCMLVLKLQAEFHHTHHFTLLHHKRQPGLRYHAYTYIEYIITRTNFFFVCRSCEKIKDTQKYKLQTSIKISKSSGKANDGAPECVTVYTC